VKAGQADVVKIIWGRGAQGKRAKVLALAKNSPKESSVKELILKRDGRFKVKRSEQSSFISQVGQLA
jgi:hypothetical protein